MMLPRAPRRPPYPERGSAPSPSGQPDRRFRPMLSHASRVVVLTLGVTAVTALLPLSAQERDRSLSQLYHTAWTAPGRRARRRPGAGADDGRVPVARHPVGPVPLRRRAVRALRARRRRTPCRRLGVRSLLALRDGGLWVGYHFGGVSLIRGGSIRSFGEGDGLPAGIGPESGARTPAASSGGRRPGASPGSADGRWHRFGPDEGFGRRPVTGILVGSRRAGSGWPRAMTVCSARRQVRLASSGWAGREVHTSASGNCTVSQEGAGRRHLGFVAGVRAPAGSLRPAAVRGGGALVSAGAGIGAHPDRPERRVLAQPRAQPGHRALRGRGPDVAANDPGTLGRRP